MTVCAHRGYHRRTGSGNGQTIVWSDYCADCGERLFDPNPPTGAPSNK